MCDSQMLREYGLLAALDSVGNMCGEQIAVITGLDGSAINTDADDKSHSEAGSVSESQEIQGITFLEIQQNSIFLSNQMYMRIGVRPLDRVLIIGNGETGAELTSMIACIRLHAVFVPVALNFNRDGNLSASSQRLLEHVISECTPTSAIVVGTSDSNPIILQLFRYGVFRFSLINASGGLVDDDPSALYSSFARPEESDATNFTNESNVYLLYTSGSSGVPKGVVGTMRGLTNRLAFQLQTFPFQFGEVALRRTPLTFVDALVEMFTPLLAAVPICAYLMPQINREGLISVVSELKQLEVSRMTLIPSQLLLTCHQLLSEPSGESSINSVRFVFVSGEECLKETVEVFARVFPTATLVNFYGSTEVAGDVTYSIIYHGDSGNSPSYHSDERALDLNTNKPDSSGALNSHILNQSIVPIGTAIAGNFLFVVKPARASEARTIELLPRYEEGELLVVGEHVAAGYYSSMHDQQRQEAKSRFIPNPFLQDSTAIDTRSGSIFATDYAPRIFQKYVGVFRGAGDDAMIEAEGTVADTHSSCKTSEVLQILRRYPTAFLTGDIVRYLPSLKRGMEGIAVATDPDHSDDLELFASVELEEEELHWLGRNDRVIKHHGVKLVLNDLERRLGHIISHSIRLRDKINPCFSGDDIERRVDVVAFLLPRISSADNSSSTSSSSAVLAAVVLRRQIPTSMIPLDTSTTFSNSKSRLQLVNHVERSLLLSLMVNSDNEIATLTDMEPPALLFLYGDCSNGETNDVSLDQMADYKVSEFPKTSSYKVDLQSLQRGVQDFMTAQLAGADTHTVNVNVANGNDVGSKADRQRTTSLSQVLDILQAILPAFPRNHGDNAYTLAMRETFFALGGDSISAIEALYRLRQLNTGVFLSLNELQSLSIEQLVDYLHTNQRSNKREYASRDNIGETVVVKDANQVDDAVNNDDLRSAKRARIIVDSRITSADVSRLTPLQRAQWHTILERGSKVTSSELSSFPTGYISGRMHDDDKEDQYSLQIAWHSTLLRCIDASPVLCLGYPPLNDSNGDQVSNSPVVLCLVGCHGGMLRALDANNGCVYWQQHFVSEHIEAAVAVHLASESVLVASYVGNNVDGPTQQLSLSDGSMPSEDMGLGTLRSLNLATGEIRWKVSLRGECKATPLVLNLPSLNSSFEADLSFSASSVSLALVGDYTGSLYIIELLSGRVVAECQESIAGAIYATPVLLPQSQNSTPHQRNVLISSTRGMLYVVSISLQHKQFEMTVQLQSSVASDTCIFATPTVLPDLIVMDIESEGGAEGVCGTESQQEAAVVIVGGTDGKVRAVALPLPPCNTFGSRETADGFGSSRDQEREVGAVEFPSAELWKTQVTRHSTPIFSSPVLAPAHRLSHPTDPEEVNLSRQCLWTGAHDGVVSCLDVVSGEIVSAHIHHPDPSRDDHSKISSSYATCDVQGVVFATLSPFLLRDSGADPATDRHMCIAATTSGTIYLLEWIYYHPEECTNCMSDRRILTDIVILGKITLPAEVFSSPALYLVRSVEEKESESSAHTACERVSSQQRIVAKVYVGCRDDHVYCIDVTC